MEQYSFDQIFKSYKDMVYTIAFRFTGNKNDALDISQETFVKVYKALPSFKGDAKLSTWIYRIAVNQALQHNRTVKNYEDIPETYYQSISFSEVSESIQYLCQTDRKKFISLALNKLKAEESTILQLYYLEDLNVEEVAEVMQLSVDNTKVKIYRSRVKLHEALTLLLKTEAKALI